MLASTVLVPLTTCLLLQQAAPPPSASRRIVVRDGDTIVIPPGVSASIDRSRDGEARLVFGTHPREIVLMFDEARGDAPPDGLVDRVWRLQLEEDFPLDLLYRGPARLEEIDPIAQGEVQSRMNPTLVTPAGRLQLGASNAAAAAPAGTTVLRITQGTGRMLNDTTWPDARTFDAVEQVWVNHLEEKKAFLRLEGRMASTMPVEPQRDERRPEPAPPSPPMRMDAVQRLPGAVAPRLIREVKPHYSAGAMERGIQGRVEMDVTIAADGTVSDVKVTRPLDPELDQIAIDTVRQWRFSPATVNGQPVPVIVTVENSFTLKRGRKR